MSVDKFGETMMVDYRGFVVKSLSNLDRSISSSRSKKEQQKLLDEVKENAQPKEKKSTNEMMQALEDAKRDREARNAKLKTKISLDDLFKM